MTYQHAVARVVGSEVQGNSLYTVIVLDRIPPSPIAPASLYHLDNTNNKVADFHQLTHRQDYALTFTTFDSKTPLSSGSIFHFIPWWSRAQLELAQGDAEQWRKQAFVPSDMALFTTESGSIGRQVTDENYGDGLIIKGGWDHEHCFLCFESISLEENTDESYTDGTNWLCKACFEAYILSKFGKKLGENVE